MKKHKKKHSKSMKGNASGNVEQEFSKVMKLDNASKPAGKGAQRWVKSGKTSSLNKSNKYVTPTTHFGKKAGKSKKKSRRGSKR